MRKPNPRCSLLLLMGFLAVEETAASSSSSNPSNRPDITAFAFRSQPEAENDSNMNSQPKSQPKSQSNDSSAVSSFEGVCVSAEAIMCTGGEAYFDFYPDFDYDEEDGESDDDEDDDDDGHSSMLSNASLRRSKVSAGGYNQQQPSRAEAPTGSDPSSGHLEAPTASTRSSIAFVGRRKTKLFGLR